MALTAVLRSGLVSVALGAVAGLGPSPAAAETPPLLCLGSTPNFLLAIRPGESADEATATFDYLGDGTFPVTPAPRQSFAATQHALMTSAGPIALTLTPLACPALGTELPVTVLLRVPAGGGTVTFLGCCLWQDG